MGSFFLIVLCSLGGTDCIIFCNILCCRIRGLAFHLRKLDVNILSCFEGLVGGVWFRSAFVLIILALYQTRISFRCMKHIHQDVLNIGELSKDSSSVVLMAFNLVAGMHTS